MNSDKNQPVVIPSTFLFYMFKIKNDLKSEIKREVLKEIHDIQEEVIRKIVLNIMETNLSKRPDDEWEIHN